MIYKYYLLNIEIINSDYIDEDCSEVELDNATETGLESHHWLGLVPLGGGLLALWWVLRGEVLTGCKIILEKKFIQ